MPQLTTASVLVELMSRADAGSGDRWIHVLPAGTFQGRDGRGPYRLADAATVIHASRERAGRVKMPIDYDHAIDLATPRGEAAPAAGWIDALQSRADGIWGRVAWTARAAEQLAQREYRYLSPAFNHTKDGTVTCILRAALTNNPNLDQLTALASMESTTMEELLTKLRTALGLPDTATIDEILAAIGDRTTARQSALDPTKFVPIGDFERVVSEVNKLNQGISLQAATDHVTQQITGGHLLPYLKDWGVVLCSFNKPVFDEFVKKTKGGLAFLRTEMITGKPPGAARTDLSQEEIAIASNIGVTKEDFLKTRTAHGTAQEH